MQDLDASLLNFTNVIASCIPHHFSSPIARPVREIFASRSANAVLSCVRAAFLEAGEIACMPPQPEQEPLLRPVLPSVAAVQSATPRLIGAVISHNQSEAIEALRDMRVFDLCGFPSLQLNRLALSVGCIVGRVRLIPLVELAIYAAELGCNDQASVYVADARELSPGPSELHNLHSVAGVLALSRGRLDEAKDHLAKSARVCQRDGYARLTCKVRRHNLMLADKLLEHGQSVIVLAYLEQCLGIWTHDRKRIGGWMEAIQAGKTPDFSEPPIRARRPEHEMLELIMWGSVFSEIPVESDLPIEEILKQMRDDYKRAVKGKLDMGKN